MVAALSALSLTLLGRGRSKAEGRTTWDGQGCKDTPPPHQLHLRLLPSLRRSRQSPFYPSLDRVHLGPLESHLGLKLGSILSN